MSINSNEFQPGSYQTKGDIFSSFKAADFPIPQGRDEAWRFVPLRKLDKLYTGEIPATGKVEFELNSDAESHIESGFLTFDDPRRGRAGAPVDRPAAHAWEESDGSNYYVTVPKNTELSNTVEVTIKGPGEGKVAYSGIMIELEENARATVVIRYQGSGAVVDNQEIYVGDNAHLNIIVIEQWNPDAHHLSNAHMLVQKDAVLRHTYNSFGGEIIRAIPRVKFKDQGGDAELLGLYFADANQYFEQRLLVDHSEPNCRSNVLYKGALQSHDGQEARTAWVGDVLIRSQALGTDTYEVNRNLILTDNCRADAVPNLEIETGEIAGAGHAATVGRFDEEQMFYLQARGIPGDVARRLIVRGFFSEVISHIADEGIRNALEDQIANELEHTQL